MLLPEGLLDGRLLVTVFVLEHLENCFPLVLGLILVGSALTNVLHAVDATCLFVELNQRLAGGVLDLEHFGSFSDGDILLLREPHKGASCLGRDGIVVATNHGPRLLPGLL